MKYRLTDCPHGYKLLHAEYVYAPWGWSKSIVEYIFKSPRMVDEEFFKDITDEVSKNINYQCVIIAKSLDVYLIIDCCDRSDWVVNESLIGKKCIYLKMQYDPAQSYPRSVFPFTYSVDSPVVFSSNLCDYRARYLLGDKEHDAWGRFIAVSIDRFKIAIKMRDAGILVGGQYCISEVGYDEHVLDPVKPRQKMPFDEYLDWCMKSNSVIDARGFGDFTHRMIECFGIGIPLIRPRLHNETKNKIVENIHYLDCGDDGRHLDKCIDMLRDVDIRKQIIERAALWYNDNCTSRSMVRLTREILCEGGFGGIF